MKDMHPHCEFPPALVGAELQIFVAAFRFVMKRYHESLVPVKFLARTSRADRAELGYRNDFAGIDRRSDYASQSRTADFFSPIAVTASRSPNMLCPIPRCILTLMPQWTPLEPKFVHADYLI